MVQEATRTKKISNLDMKKDVLSEEKSENYLY